MAEEKKKHVPGTSVEEKDETCPCGRYHNMLPDQQNKSLQDINRLWFLNSENPYKIGQSLKGGKVVYCGVEHIVLEFTDTVKDDREGADPKSREVKVQYEISLAMLDKWERDTNPPKDAYDMIGLQEPTKDNSEGYTKQAHAQVRWTPNQNIELLQEELEEIEENIDEKDWERGMRLTEAVDLSSLPSSEKYKDRVDRVSTYPVWACDDNGKCLVGSGDFHIQHIDDIEEVQPMLRQASSGSNTMVINFKNPAQEMNSAKMSALRNGIAAIFKKREIPANVTWAGVSAGQIIITIQEEPFETESYEEIEDEIRDFLKSHKVSATIEDEVTGNTTQAKKISDKASDWISRKIKFLVESEGKSQEQAAAIAYSMAREKGMKVPKKKKADRIPQLSEEIAGGFRDQYGNSVPTTDLVVLSGENPSHYDDETIELIRKADWYEVNNIILVPASQIDNAIETEPEDAGIDWNDSDLEIWSIAPTLYRWSEEDGFYHV